MTKVNFQKPMVASSDLYEQQIPLVTLLLSLAMLMCAIQIWLNERNPPLGRGCRATQNTGRRLAKQLPPHSPVTSRVPRESTGRIHKEQYTEVHVTDRVGYWTVTGEVHAMFGENETVLLEDSTCSICLVDYEHGDTIQRNFALGKSPCTHVFHKDCVMTWLDTDRRECPCCRSAFVVYQRVEI